VSTSVQTKEPPTQDNDTEAKMFEKNGKYYADWRDRTGRRQRKSFTSQRAALRYEEEQKELAHPKPQARVKLSPHYSVPFRRGSVVTIAPHATRRKPSST